MSLKVFKNKNKPTWAENKFFDFLIDELKDTNLEVGLFFNTFVDGTELDALIATEKGIFILEYKNFSGRLFASENDEWKLLKANGKEIELTHNKSRENVFQQVRRQRFSLKHLIDQKFSDIFPEDSIESKSTHHIGSYLIFEMLDSNSKLDMANKTRAWLSILSKEYFIKDFYHRRPSNLTFGKAEIFNLAKVLKMDQVIDDEEVSDKVSDSTCPVCLYSEDCHRKYLNGEVIEIDNRKIRIKSDDIIYNLHYNKNTSTPVFKVDNNILGSVKEDHFDDTELKILSSVFDHFNKRKLGSVEVNFFHLQALEEGDLEINSETLMIILPSWLYSVTSFTNLDFCERNVLTQKFSSAPNNNHLLRGSAVNEALGSIIENPTALEPAKDQSRSYVQSKVIELIASDTDPEEINQAIDTEVDTLGGWAENYNLRENKSTEEFIVSPKLGLKGKIDLVLKDNENRIVDILELKSSTPDYRTKSIKEYHELQVVSYGIMVLLRQGERFQDLNGESPSVIYSKADGDIRKPAKFDSEVFSKVFKYRNILLNSEFGLRLPNPYPHPMMFPNGCEKCSVKEICMDLCRIVQEEYCDPTCFKHPENLEIGTKCSLQTGLNKNIKSQFMDWIEILNDIKILNHKKYADIISAEQSTNISNGKILELTDLPFEESSTNKTYVYKLTLKNGNYSEFREFDVVLLSDKYDLEKAELNLGKIRRLTYDHCHIELNKKLQFVPKFIFPYYPDSSESVNFVGLYESFFGSEKLFNLIEESTLEDVLKNLNIELHQGVPGSGKTTKIVNKIIKLSEQGKKIFVATFTNKAIDNIHEKLIEEDENLDNKIHRFGSSHQKIDNTFSISADYNDVNAATQELEQKSIFLSTIHAANSELVKNVAKYDCVIIDEASQINIPMSFIPFSLSNNISLVGDHFQLPPIFSEQVVDQNNDKKSFLSIFETLWINSEGLINDDNRDYSNHQYRMAKEIIAYPSKLFYNNKITTDDIVELHLKEFIDSFNDEWKDSSISDIIDPSTPSLWLQVDSSDSNNNARLNQDEANHCNTIIDELLKSGIEPSQIGVISPFRLQVNTIKDKVFKSLGDERPEILDKLQIDTIDRFQGSQKDVIIISLCTSDSENNFLIKDLRRFNVALTRPRFKRIILGDLQSFVSTENENNEKIAGIINDGYTKFVEPSD